MVLAMSKPFCPHPCSNKPDYSYSLQCISIIKYSKWIYENILLMEKMFWLGNQDSWFWLKQLQELCVHEDVKRCGGVLNPEWS